MGLLTVVVIGIRGFDYYTTPGMERPFHADYDAFKPTGLYGHGLGIIGSLMIAAGVLIYSGRKRLRRLSGLGSVKYFLEFHIFLCLTGPMLVLYHTTFKFGGLVAVSFWSMIAVVLSGLVGRYFYVQIPRGIKGNELSVAELNAENQRLAASLQTDWGVPASFLQLIDAIATPPKAVAAMSLFDVMRFFVLNDLTRRSRLQQAIGQLKIRREDHALVKHLRKFAIRKIALTRRIAFLEKFRRIFYYWHVIHLPFSVVMFIILFIHVGVAVAFGYTWIF